MSSAQDCDSVTSTYCEVLLTRTKGKRGMLLREVTPLQAAEATAATWWKRATCRGRSGLGRAAHPAPACSGCPACPAAGHHICYGCCDAWPHAERRLCWTDAARPPGMFLLMSLAFAVYRHTVWPAAKHIWKEVTALCARAECAAVVVESCPGGRDICSHQGVQPTGGSCQVG